MDNDTMTRIVASASTGSVVGVAVGNPELVSILVALATVGIREFIYWWQHRRK